MADDPFTDMVADLFADPTYAEDGLYTPLGGVAVACPGIRSRRDQPQSGGVTGVLRRGWRLLLPMSVAAAQPADGATWAVDGVTLTIRSARRDALRQFWTCDADDT